MKRNLLQNVVGFIVRYIWIFCAILVILECISTMYSATLLLQRTSLAIAQAQAGEVSGRVDGVLRLLNGMAEDEVIGDTSLPLYDRAIKTRSYQKSYGLYMIAVLDKEFNMVPANATEPPKKPNSRADRDYLQRMKATGTYQITDVILSRTDGVTRNYTIAVPMIKDGKLDGGIYGSIYLNDIKNMLSRDNQGEFFLLGRNHTVMVDSENKYNDKTLNDVYDGLLFGHAKLEKLQSDSRKEASGGFWTLSSRGLTYISYCDVNLTDWSLIYEGNLTMVLPVVLPMLLTKVFAYFALCWTVAYFGKRYLKHQLTFASHLMDRVTSMQKELFKSEQDDYDGLLDLTQQGLTDHLTGLSTRGVLIQRFSQFTKETNSKGMLCFLDLDDLKQINDTFGHETGDRALLHFAKILKEYEQKYEGIASRYGGDEFVLVLDNIDEHEGEKLMEELCHALTESLFVDHGTNSIMIHGSIGVAFYPTHGTSLEVLISKADLALYISKHGGKGRYSIYEEQS